MGLSDEERRSGLYRDINEICNLSRYLKEHLKSRKYVVSEYDNLFFLTDQLWHAFLGKTRNSGHWLSGSSATNSVDFGTGTAWGVAINHHCGNILKENYFEESSEFNAFDDFLSVSGLLSHVSECLRDVYMIYAMTEQVVYYLRRYEDDFSDSLGALDKVVSDIQGECFNFFKKEEAFAKAYVLNAICVIIYGPHYPYNKDKMDAVTRFFQKNAAHHDLSRMMVDGSLKELAQIHTDLHKASVSKKLTKYMRIEAFMKLAGRRYHYDHKFKELSEILRKDRFRAEDIGKLKVLFEECKADHEANEKRSQEDYKRGQYSPLSIYGDILVD